MLTQLRGPCRPHKECIATIYAQRFAFFCCNNDFSFVLFFDKIASTNKLHKNCRWCPNEQKCLHIDFVWHTSVCNLQRQRAKMLQKCAKNNARVDSQTRRTSTSPKKKEFPKPSNYNNCIQNISGTWFFYKMFWFAVKIIYKITYFNVFFRP